MDPASRQRQLHDRVKRVTQMCGRRQPAVTFLEDLHWFDGGSEAFLEPIVEALPGTQGLVLVNFRPEYHAAWMQKSYYQQLPLLPLGPEAIAELLRDLLGGDPSLAHSATASASGRAGTRSSSKRWCSRSPRPGASRARGRIGWCGRGRAAPSRHGPGRARRSIDRLAEREKQVLQTAAVIGREFTEPILRRVVELPEAELAAALQRLTAAEFIYEEALGPEAEYTFKHPLTQEVAYRSQLSERRERVHAEWRARSPISIATGSTRKPRSLATLGSGGDAVEAASWHDRAARWAVRSHLTQAVQHWRKVRELVQQAPDSLRAPELDLRACLGLLFVASGAGLSEEEARVLYSPGRTSPLGRAIFEPSRA